MTEFSISEQLLMSIVRHLSIKTGDGTSLGISFYLKIISNGSLEKVSTERLMFKKNQTLTQLKLLSILGQTLYMVV